MDKEKDNNHDEVSDFLSMFDNESMYPSESHDSDVVSSDDDSAKLVHRSRRSRKEKDKKSRSQSFADNNKTKEDFEYEKTNINKNEVDNTDMTRKSNKKSGKGSGKKKYRFNKKQFFKFILAIFIVLTLVVVVYAASIIIKAPDIDPDNIYSQIQLSESSVLYDDDGEVIENVFSEQNRTNVEYKVLPKNLVNAFIALEDKTFEKHHGFNIIRIFGAIKDGLLTGTISGTSTITQQLARNVYLTDEMSEHSISRKIAEAYYTVILERKLTKDQIMEAYLNTIYFGYGSYGVQAASQSYFSKDVQDLTLAECATLAALPQSPDYFSLIKYVTNDSVNENDKTILSRSSAGTYVYNDASKDRRELCLDLMLEQGKINQQEYDKAIKKSLKKMLNPNFDSMSTNSSYFTDYVIEEVTEDLMKEFDISYDEAKDRIYKKGYKIHTTLDSQAQAVVEKEFD
ncbi:MAG: transglycosylase domain-containing protein, partial [Anaerovoracaceae bacterium]